ncbi:flavin reductase family protein [Zunongwangia sp. H14]|uniref:flavin reductase family protein n=1 Tax=Zunongwangia sp. H14 TaxID=3240792 RepID=UPI0035685AF6
MLTIDSKESASGALYRYLSGAVAPRPIAFASTIDAEGNVNLSPFSFFNVFSANPPILVFAPVRRGKDGTVKDTFLNCRETRECVINIVNYNMVQQMSLSSTDFERGVNEFEKAGLGMLPSEEVKPFRVAESPVQFECRVNEIIELGDTGGAGSLIVCEILKTHIKEDILDAEGYIDPVKIDQVARLGGNWYARAKEGLFEVPKPLAKIGMGVDQIPQEIRNSSVLTGNDLGRLGNIEVLPSKEEIDAYLRENPKLAAAVAKGDTKGIHTQAQLLIEENKTEEAWKILLAK